MTARICGHCERPCGDGPDPCLGHLPGVISACCGHGVTPPYLWTELDAYYHTDAVEIMRKLGGAPPDLEYKPGRHTRLTAEQRQTARER